VTGLPNGFGYGIDVDLRWFRPVFRMRMPSTDEMMADSMKGIHLALLRSTIWMIGSERSPISASRPGRVGYENLGTVELSEQQPSGLTLPETLLPMPPEVIQDLLGQD
jgi:hypothetical protein